MKKIICALLCAVIVLSLAACSALPGGSKTTTSGEKKEDKQEKMMGGIVKTDEGDYVYMNDYFNVRFAPPEDWEFYGESELAALNKDIMEMMSDENVRKALEQGNNPYVLYAMGSSGVYTVNICLEKLSAINGVLMDEKSYVAAGIEGLRKAVEGTELELVDAQTEQIKICGKEHAGARLKLDYGGVAVYEILAAIKRGNYVAVITVATAAVDATDDVVTFFSAAE